MLDEGVADPDGGGPERREGLAGDAPDVLCGQEESVLALVRQLHEEDPLDALRLGPVVGAAAGAVLERVRRTDLPSTSIVEMSLARAWSM